MKDRDFNTTVNLVRAAQKGDRGALEDLITRYMPRVQQIVALRMGRRLRQFVALEDVVQEVMLRLFRDIDRFEEKTEGSFRNWLAKCVECEIVDQARKIDAKKRGAGKVRRFGDYPEDASLSSVFAGRGPTPSQVAGGKETEEKIEEALLGVPKHWREVFILRHLCQMSYREIAESMGFGSEQSARKAFSRALQKLREKLREQLGG